MTESSVPSGYVRDDAGLVAVLRAEDWERPGADDVGVDLTDVDYVARLVDPEIPFHMNVVVTHTASSAPIEEASSLVIAAAYEQHPGALVIGCDSWIWAPFPARCIQFSYPAGELSIVVTRWVFATGRNQIHLVASRATEQYVLSDEFFNGIATSLIFSEEA